MTVTMHRGDEHADVWAKLAAPIPATAISWRQDGKPMTRDNKFFARFVAYIDAGTVRERLDSIVSGEWNLTLELLPPSHDHNGEEAIAFKARLSILGVAREDVGTGKDYKQASTDAFKRAAVRFGIGHELYEYEQNWVQMDGDGKYAKPAEDPQDAYERRMARKGVAPARSEAPAPREQPASAEPAEQFKTEGGAPSPFKSSPPCPKCGGKMWDNRKDKRNPKAPDFKCRDRSCDGVIWPPKENGKQKATAPAVHTDESDTNFDGGDDSEIPF